MQNVIGGAPPHASPKVREDNAGLVVFSKGNKPSYLYLNLPILPNRPDLYDVMAADHIWSDDWEDYDTRWVWVIHGRSWRSFKRIMPVEVHDGRKKTKS